MKAVSPWSARAAGPPIQSAVGAPARLAHSRRRKQCGGGSLNSLEEAANDRGHANKKTESRPGPDRKQLRRGLCRSERPDRVVVLSPLRFRSGLLAAAGRRRGKRVLRCHACEPD